MYEIPCVIFAGGKSSRMGEDKALLPFDTSPTLTQYQLKKLSKLFHSVFIACKSKEKFSFSAQFIEDEDKELFAPTAAFISIFHALQTERFFAISVDTPFIDQTIISKLLAQDTKECDATIALLNGKMQPLCGIYHASLLQPFEEMQKQNNHKLGYLLKNSNVNFVHFDNEKKFLNLNNKEEYTQALQIVNTSLI